MTRPTSLSAYSDLVTSGALGAKQRAVWGLLSQGRPMTGRELDRELGWTQDAHKRLSELEVAGVVKVVGERLCSVTGRKVCEWYITEKDPNTVTPEDFQRGESKKRPSKAEIAQAVTFIRSHIRPNADGSLEKTLAWLNKLAG